MLSNLQTPLAKSVKVKPHELLDLFQSFMPNIEVLSLDCFDTLLWRKTLVPKDVFIDLQNHSAFEKAEITANLRAYTESKARAFNYVANGSSEVKLKDIYSQWVAVEDIDQLIEAEVATEIAACYAFKPVVDLILLAKSFNKKVIIVSDTYFTSAQLKKLLAAKLPQSAFEAIKHVFCSSEFGQSKAGGLFKRVVPYINTRTDLMLHIGDNEIADSEAPRKLNINAWQLLQQELQVNEMTNMRTWAASFLNQDIRHTRSPINPFAGLFAIQKNLCASADKILGFMSLGQIMYGFAQFIAKEVKVIRDSSPKVKVLFLLRDGHLISKVCKNLFGENFGTPVRISRFASYAASFRSKQDIQKYLAETVVSSELKVVCKQLLLATDFSNSMIEQAERSADKISRFIELVSQQHVVNYILVQSKKYRERLITYLKKYAGIENDDTVIFIDLGYRGTSQKILSPIFAEELSIKIFGLYLIALKDVIPSQYHKGLLDFTNCDERTLSMLVNYIALFEQLNTMQESSVVDYTETGEPIFSNNELQAEQNQKLKAIQESCIQFISQTDRYLSESDISLNQQELRDLVMAELARFIFLPSQPEIDYLREFQFDFNLGTNKVLNVFDVEQGLQDLRNRGLFFMEKNINSMRTNYPAELRATSFELSMTLMAHERFKSSIGIKELSFRAEKIPVIVMSNGKHSREQFSALPTFDGYFALIIPVGSGGYQIGMQFGMRYKWLELYSAQLIHASYYLSDHESQYTQDAKDKLQSSNMVERDAGLFECLSDAGLLAYIPDSAMSNVNYLLRVVFRPVVHKKVNPGV